MNPQPNPQNEEQQEPLQNENFILAVAAYSKTDLDLSKYWCPKVVEA